MSAIRDARIEDLPALVRLLAQLHDAPPAPPTEQEREGFDSVTADPRQRLLVVEHEGAVIGSASLVIVPNVGHDGTPYALVENVIVDESVRGQRHGEALLRYMIDAARSAGCYKVVLTSRKQRKDAHRFYARLGFEATSEGFRYTLIED